MMSLIIYYFFLMFLVFFKNWVVLLNFFILGFFYFFFTFSLNNYFSNLSYFFGLDLISFFLFFLSIWITYLMIISSYDYKYLNNSVLFVILVFFLLFFLVFSFSSLNIFVFYFFFESSLIPTLMLIFGWGYQPERLSSGYYLLFYTLFGSLPLLLIIFYIYNYVDTMFFGMIFFDLFNLYIYIGMILGFLFKMPMFIFHFWLPKAHVEAPISGSMILAAILLKLGGYGLIRVFGFLYKYVLEYNFFFILLSLFGSVFISFVCMYQFDIKSLIAYSSVCHMGLVICGIFTMNYLGLLGSLILMIGHGLCSSGLFCLANIVYDRTKSRSFYINKGLINLMPSLSLFWFLFCSNNMASPPSLNLLGEIILMNSLISWCTLSFIFLFLSCFLSCCYSMYLYSNLQHGHYYNGLKILSNINVREYYLLTMHFIPLNLIILTCDIYFILV